MDKYRPIFSKAITLSRMNSSQTNRKAPSFCRLHTNSDSKSTVSPIFSVEQNQSFHRYSAQCNSFRRSFASAAGTETQQLSQLDFEQYCAETLESLTDYFDELVEKFKEFEAADVVYKVISHFTVNPLLALFIYSPNFHFQTSGWSADGEFGTHVRHLRD